MIRLMGIQLKVAGQHHIRKNQTYLVMGNHQSLFDLFVIPSAIPFSFVGIEAAEHFSLPLWGHIIKKWGNIPIKRENRNVAIKNLESAAALLKTGTSIGVLPEGHRTRTGKVQPFKKGPFYLALASGADILPFGIKGLYQYHQKGSFLLTPGSVTVTIGRPICYEEYQSFTVDQLKNRVQQTIEALAS
jgi:1-acyl-sn-glycerol-3-phosphate acyltransferase